MTPAAQHLGTKLSVMVRAHSPAACLPPYIVVKVALFGGLVRIRFGGLLLLEQLEPVLAALQLQQLDLKRRPPHQFDASNRP